MDMTITYIWMRFCCVTDAQVNLFAYLYASFSGRTYYVVMLSLYSKSTLILEITTWPRLRWVEPTSRLFLARNCCWHLARLQQVMPYQPQTLYLTGKLQLSSLPNIANRASLPQPPYRDLWLCRLSSDYLILLPKCHCETVYML